MITREQATIALESINYIVETSGLIIDHRKIQSGFRLTETHIETIDHNSKSSLLIGLDELEIIKVGITTITFKLSDKTFLSFYNMDDFT